MNNTPGHGDSAQVVEPDYSKGFNEEDFTNYCCAQLKQSLSDHKDIFAHVDRMRDAWRDVVKEKLYPWKYCSNVSTPVISTAIDGITPRIVEGTFDFDNPVQVKGMNSTSDASKDIIKAFVNWDLAAHPELYEMFWLGAQNVGWAGTMFVKSYFFSQKKVKPEKIEVFIVKGKIAKDPNTGVPLSVDRHNINLFDSQRVPYKIAANPKKKFKWAKYGPEGKLLNFKDVLFPKGTTSLQQAFDETWVADRVFYTKDQLRRLCKKTGGSIDGEKSLFDNLDWEKIKNFENIQDTDEGNKNWSKSRLLEFWEIKIKYDIDGDELEEYVVALIHLSTKQLVGWEEFPYAHGRCPIIACKIQPLDGSPYGISTAEKLFGLYLGINKERNQRIDRNDLHNSPPLLVTDKAGYKPSKHFPGPGRTWLMERISEDVMKFQTPPSRHESFSFKEEEMYRIWVQQRGGFTDFSMGSGSPTKNDTARGIEAVIAEGNIGFRNYNKWFSMGVAEFFNQRLALQAQYWGEAADEEVEGWIQKILDTPENPLAVEGGMDALKQKFNLTMTAFKQDKRLELQKAIGIHDIAKEDPNFQQNPHLLREVVIDVWRKMGVQSPEELYPTIEAIKEYQVGIQKQAMQEMQAERDEQSVKQAEGKGFIEEQARLKVLDGKDKV